MDLKTCIEMDIKYVQEFSTAEKLPYGFRVFDVHQRDKYYHNYLHLLNDSYTLKDIADYMNHFSEFGHLTFRVESSASIPELVKQKKFDEIEHRYYLQHIDTVNISATLNEDISIVNPYRDDDFFEFLLEDTKIYGDDYAIKNIARLKRVLKNSFQLNYYQIKYHGEVIGYINTFTDKNIAKIDDFTIKTIYRNQGYGSKLMRYVIEDLKKKNIEYVYLITEEKDTPKTMYEKWHFKHVGNFTLCGLKIK